MNSEQSEFTDRMRVAVRSIAVESDSAMADELRRRGITSGQAAAAIAAAMSESAAKGRQVTRGLLQNARSFAAHNELLTSVRLSEMPLLRRMLVEAFDETDQQLDLITGLSLMTTRDAALFFRDYFEIGGSFAHVQTWLAGIATYYVQQKRAGHIQPDLDGFWDDVWNRVIGTGKAIGEAITTVVDAVVQAGKTFGEIAEDVAGESQARLNAIIETLLDTGRDVGEFVAGALQAAAGAVEHLLEKVCKAVLAAGRGLDELLQALYDHAATRMREWVAMLLRNRVRIRDLLVAAAQLADEKLRDVVGWLIELGHSVSYIVRWAFTRADAIVQLVFAALLNAGRTLAELVAVCVRRSIQLLRRGLQALIALGQSVQALVVALLADLDTVASKGLRVLLELGATVLEFLQAAAAASSEYVRRLYFSLRELEIHLEDILKEAAQQGYETFKAVVSWLREAGIRVAEWLIFQAGFAWDDDQKIFYSRLEPWQANFGYFTLYDDVSPLVGIYIHCEPILFTYDGRKWKIEFWKGQYGACTGAEIGIYTGKLTTDIAVLDHTISQLNLGDDVDCASGDDMLSMSFVLKEQGRVLFTRNSDDGATPATETHWWLTGFKLLKFTKPSDLVMELSIALKDDTMCQAFVAALEGLGYARPTDFDTSGTRVDVTFGVPRTAQPVPLP